MGQQKLDPGTGMLFLFPGSTQAGFWMKDTTIPLSLAVWGDRGRVLDILAMHPCRKDPCTVYQPRGPYRVALEMSRGWFDRHGVRIGDAVEYDLLNY
jgi:uncharacterized membrane protein (UPF0127 family)